MDNKLAAVIVTVIVLILKINFHRNLGILRLKMRELWSEHVWWTREFLVATLVAAPNAASAAARLMANQDHIGAAYGSYFGKSRGAALATLLKEHITIAVEVVGALATAALALQLARWNENADEITRFMAADGVNKMHEGHVDQSMMRMHLVSTTAETVALASQKFPESVAAFETVLAEAGMMADMMAREIARARLVTFAFTVGRLPCCI